MEKLKLKTIKIASGEIESLDILDYLSKKVDIIISTGASTINEIKAALKNSFKKNLSKTNNNFTLHHVLSS